MNTGPLTAEQRQARLEDLQWLVDTGETLTGALKRLDITKSALDKWCRNHDCWHLFARLAAREHIDPERTEKNANRIHATTRRTAA